MNALAQSYFLVFKSVLLLFTEKNHKNSREKLISNLENIYYDLIDVRRDLLNDDSKNVLILGAVHEKILGWSANLHKAFILARENIIF